MAEPQKIPLCRMDALDDPGSRGVDIETPLGRHEVVLVRKGGVVFGYQNRCPHTGINLEWLPDQFLDPSGGFIQCATHGALFRIEDGFCVRGPCAGRSLRMVELRIETGTVVLCIPVAG